MGFDKYIANIYDKYLKLWYHTKQFHYPKNHQLIFDKGAKEITGGKDRLCNPWC